MKTIEQIQDEVRYGEVFNSNDFAQKVISGSFNKFDGVGFFHNGENETNISVWDKKVTLEYFKEYPYVCWYNK